MIIFQYKCSDCLSIFEAANFTGGLAVSCVNCNSKRTEKNNSINFSPKKTYCPHNKVKI